MAYFDKYGVQFSDDGKTLISCPQEFQGEYIIPNSVIRIDESAFSDCFRLDSITISDSVTEIGAEAFARCSRLLSITIGQSVTSIGSEAFSDCTSLTSITIPNSVTRIGTRAFCGCEKLDNVILPHSLSLIALCAFEQCGVLHSINLPIDAAFCFCKKCKNTAILDKIEHFEAYNCIGKCLIDVNKNMTGEFEVPKNITSINRHAFKDCKELTSIILHDGISYIGRGAFQNCENLISINLPNSLNTLGNQTFKGCHHLTSIYFPDNIQEVTGESIFSDVLSECKQLQTIHLPSSFSFKEFAFQDFTELRTINVPSGTSTIPQGCFRNCISLRCFSLPNSVTQIGDCAFYGCTNLKKISIPKGQKARFAQMDGLRDLEHLLVESTLDSISGRSWETCIAEWNNYLKSLQESEDQMKRHLYKMIIKHKGVALWEVFGPIGLELTVEEYRRFKSEGQPLQDIQYWCQSGAEIHEMIRKRINNRHSRINDYLSARAPRKGYYKVVEMEQDCDKEDLEWSILKCYYNYRTPDDFLKEIVEINYKPLTNKVSVGPKRRLIKQGDIIHVKEDTTLVDGEDFKSYRVVWEII